MSSICRKCGKEIDGSSPICMHCGASIPDSELKQETKDKMVVENKDTPTFTNASSTKALGAVIMIIGFITDIISMFMITSGSFEGFGAITIFGTIAFFIGLALISNG